MSGAKIIEGLKEAVAGNFSAVTIEGQRWVRQDAPSPPPVAAERAAIRAIIVANNDFRKSMPADWDGDPLQDAINEAAKLLLPSHAAAEQVTAEPVLAATIGRMFDQLAFDKEMPASRNSALRKAERVIALVRASPAPADQADEIEHWKNEASKKDAELTIARSQLASAERTVETMDNNHRSMASLLADTGRERDKLAKQLEKAKFALEECCHMAGAHTETDAEDWLNSIREYSRKQLLALTDDVREEPGYTQYTSFRP